MNQGELLSVILEMKSVEDHFEELKQRMKEGDIELIISIFTNVTAASGLEVEYSKIKSNLISARQIQMNEEDFI